MPLARIAFKIFILIACDHRISYFYLFPLGTWTNGSLGILNWADLLLWLSRTQVNAEWASVRSRRRLIMLLLYTCHFLSGISISRHDGIKLIQEYISYPLNRAFIHRKKKQPRLSETIFKMTKIFSAQISHDRTDAPQATPLRAQKFLWMKSLSSNVTYTRRLAAAFREWSEMIQRIKCTREIFSTRRWA